MYNSCGNTIVGIYNKKYNVRSIVSGGLIALKQTVCKVTKTVIILIRTKRRGSYYVKMLLENYAGDAHIIDIIVDSDKAIKPLELHTLINYSENHSMYNFAIAGVCFTDVALLLYKPDAHEMLKMIMGIDQLQIYCFHSKYTDQLVNIRYEKHIDLLNSVDIIVNNLCSGITADVIDTDTYDFGYDMENDLIIERLKALMNKYKGNAAIVSPGSTLTPLPINISDDKINQINLCVEYDESEQSGLNSDNEISINSEESYVTTQQATRRKNYNSNIKINTGTITPCDVSAFTFTKSFSELQKTKTMTIPTTKTINQYLLDDIEATSNIISDNSFYYLAQYLNNATVVDFDKNMVFKAHLNVGVGNLIYLLGEFYNAMKHVCYLLLQIEINPINNRAVLKFFSVNIENRTSVISQSSEITLQKYANISIYHSNTYKTYSATICTITDSGIHLAGNNAMIEISYLTFNDFINHFIVGCPVYTGNAMHRVSYSYNPILWELATKLPRKMMSETDNLLIGPYDRSKIGTVIDKCYFATVHRSLSINSKDITKTHKKMCKLLGSHLHFKFMLNTVHDSEIIGLDECNSKLFEITVKKGVPKLRSYCSDRDVPASFMYSREGYKWVRIFRLPGLIQFFVNNDDKQFVINHVTGTEKQLTRTEGQINLFRKPKKRNIQKDGPIEIIDDISGPGDILYPPMSQLESEKNEEFIGNVSLPVGCDIVENITLYIKIHSNVTASDNMLLYGGYIVSDSAQSQSHGILTAGNDKYLLQARYEHEDSTVYYLAPPKLQGDISSRCNFTSISSEIVLN